MPIQLIIQTGLSEQGVEAIIDGRSVHVFVTTQSFEKLNAATKEQIIQQLLASHLNPRLKKDSP